MHNVLQTHTSRRTVPDPAAMRVPQVDSELHHTTLDWATSVLNASNASAADGADTAGACAYHQHTENASGVSVTVFTGASDAMSAGELASGSGFSLG